MNHQQHQTQIIPPLRIYVNPIRSKNKKLRKDGHIICYKCHWCRYQSFNLGHTKSHMSKCIQRQIVKRKEEHRNLFQKYVERQRSHINQELMNVEDQQQDVQIKTKINSIEKRIKALQTGQYTNRNQKINIAKRISQQIIQQNSNLFIGCIQVQLSKVIKTWLQMNIDVQNVKFEIVSKILDKLRQINFYDLVDNFKKNLDRFQQEYQKNIHHIVHPRTWARIEMSYNFLKKYEEIHLIHQVKLIEDLMNQSPYLRKHVVRYHKKMVTQYSDLFPYKTLPKRLSIFEQITPKKQIKISMDRVKQEVITLIQKEEFQLATDIWSTTCMGFRKSQLMNMKFQNQNGEFAFALKMYQQKNKHETIRLVPLSLKNLIKTYKIQYPMTKWRFMRLKNFCFTHFSAFYGLRHLCFTTLMAGLFQNNILARVHKDHRTTSTFYIDQQSANLINKMFSLRELKDIYHEQMSSQYKLFLIFDKQATIYEQRIYQSDRITLPPPNISAEQNIEIRQIDGLASSNDNEMKTFLQNSHLSLDEKCQIVTKRYNIVYQDKQSNLESFHSLQKTLQSLIEENPENISQVINQEISSRGQIGTDQKFIMLTSQILQNPVKFISFKQNDSKPLIIKQINYSQQEYDPVYIYKHCTSLGQKIFQIQQDQKIKINNLLRQSLKRNTKQNKKYAEDRLPILKYLAPLCSFCRKQRINLKICHHNVHGYSYCQSCQKKIQNCQNSNKISTKVKIISQNFRQSKDYYSSIKKVKNKNNIKFIIQSKKLIMVKTNKYKSDVPDFATLLPVFSKKMKAEIIYNRNYQEFLPIQLRFISNEKGYGVFALQKIPKNQLICTYDGVIGTHRSCDITHDSSFTLGWLQDRQGNPLNIITEAKQFCNVGRFLNSSNFQGAPDMNCECKYGVIQEESNFQIVIIMYTIKQVEVNDELIWFYGNQYWQS